MVSQEVSASEFIKSKSGLYYMSMEAFTDFFLLHHVDPANVYEKNRSLPLVQLVYDPETRGAFII